MENFGKSQHLKKWLLSHYQILLAMKFTIILTVALLQVRGGAFSQNVTLSGHNLSMKKFFAEIEKQTGYTFFCNTDLLDIAKPVSLNVKKSPLPDVLNTCFSGEPFGYYIQNKTVFVTEKTLPPASLAIDTVPAEDLKPIAMKGKVLDEQGQPVSYASIKIKRNNRGAIADDQGNFIIEARPGDVLLISGVGIHSSQYNVEGTASSIRITVSRSAGALTEVVVTALGQTQSKARIGYATQTFSTATINKNGVTGALDGLEGKIAGAEISNTGGPGSSTKVVLRGYGIIGGGNNQPLYVVDGVPLSDGIFGGSAMGSDVADFGNGMNNINPNDIESISILKGSAASSLYGGLAKNGAIIITTKKGKAGALKIEYTGSANFSKVGKLPDYQSEFGQGWGGLFVSDENGSWGPRLDGVTRPWGSIVNGDQLSKPFSFVKNNLRDFYTTGHEYNNTLALSGGNDANRFYFSYGNVSSVGIVPVDGNTQQRNTLSLRTNSNYDRFTLNTSINYVGQRLNVPNTGENTSSGGGVFFSILEIPVDVPITAFKNINSKFNNIDNFFTPYAENPYFGLNENGDQQNLIRAFGNIDMGYKITSGLSADLKIGGDFTNARTFIWKQLAYAAPGSWNGPYPTATNPEGASRTPDLGQVTQGSDYYGIVNTDFILKYNTKLGHDFSLDVLGGANYYVTNQKSEATTVTNLVVPSFYNLSNTSNPPTTIDFSEQLRRVGLYGEATLGYKDQLFLTGNIRNDWSSSLPIEKNSILYPGASLSWVASQMIGPRSTLSFLKFRAAYGRTGSDPAPYQVYPTLATGSIPLGLGFLTTPFNGVSGFSINNTIGNLNLKPIFTTEYEVGTEARFFKDRIGLDLTLYDRNTIGQIFGVPIAPSTGYTSLIENLGTINNKGIELTFNAKPVQTRHFTWTFNYVFTRNWNKVINLNGTSPDPLLNSVFDVELRAVVGKSVASIYTGVPQKNAAGQLVVNPGTGLTNNNTTVLDPVTGQTKGYYGSGLYDYTMGFSNTFTYRDFSLNFSLDFRHGGVMYSETADLSLFVGNSITTTYNDRKPYIIPNSVVAGPNGTYTKNTTYVGSAGNGETDQYYNTYSEGSSYSGQADAQRIIDRSFLKLRDVNLSYNLPHRWSSKIKAGSASVGVYGRNFLLWTPKSNVYVDPEATNLGNDLQGEMGEFASTPLTKSYGFILKVSF